MITTPWGSAPSRSPDPPWQRLLDRINCLRNGGEDCRQSFHIHLAILSLVLTLALFRKALVAGPLKAKSLPPRLKSRAVVDDILVHPVKSCAAVSLEKARIGRKGLELDRRWMVVRRGKEEGKWDKISLREEPRLTLIQPCIEADGLHLSLSAQARLPDGVQSSLPPIAIPYRTTRDNCVEVLPSVAMWGDSADGLVVPLLPSSSSPEWSDSPSLWLSHFLGYEVRLIQFGPLDPSTEGKRRAFPIYKDAYLAGKAEQARMRSDPQPLEWQDEYPLLVASQESLRDLQERIADAGKAEDGSDGRGGRGVSEKMFSREKWKERAGKGEADWLNIRRFRANIVLRGVDDEAESQDGAAAVERSRSIRPWEEDQWTRIDFPLPSSSSSPPETTTPCLHLVARCERCLLTTVDPITGEKQDAGVPLAFLRKDERSHLVKHMKEKGGHGRKGPIFGMYAIPGMGEEEGEEGFEVQKGMEVTCWWRREGEE